MAFKSITHVIIPAAGFGKRVGLPISKELLYYKSEEFRIIEWSLRLCKNYGMLPVVISRKDKIDLNTFLRTQYPEAQVCMIDSSEEWTHSVYLSSDFWGDKNILLLPDSRFEPTQILEQIERGLSKHDLIFATFEVSDPSKWGVLSLDALEIAEKPIHVQSSFLAWGLIGFIKNSGRKLFSDLMESSRDHAFKKLQTSKVDFMSLKSYEDITRSATDLKVNLES